MRKMSCELEFIKRAQYRVAMDDVGIVAENPAMKEILAAVSTTQMNIGSGEREISEHGPAGESNKSERRRAGE
jgi:replication-associated recombination protein RarA